MTGARWCLQLSFPQCVLPGCATHVDDYGDVCAGCVASFGPMLRTTDKPAMTAEEVADRDGQVHAAYAAQREAARG